MSEPVRGGSRWRVIALVAFTLLGLFAVWAGGQRVGSTPLQAARVKGESSRQAPAEQPRLEEQAVSLRSTESVSPAIDGSVANQQGAGLSGAVVCGSADAAAAIERGGESNVQCTTTDVRGRFHLAADGAPFTRISASAAGYLPLAVTLPARVATTAPITLTLVPGGARVAGRVVDATGGVVAGATIQAAQSTAEGAATTTVSDASGEFSLNVAGGATELTVRAEAYSEARLRLVAPSAGIIVVLAPPASLRGQVVAEGTALPLRDVLVTASKQSGWPEGPWTSVSGPDGRFQFDRLSGGGYTLVAHAARWLSAEHWVTLDIGESRADLLLEVSAAGSLQGVVSLDGAPCSRGGIDVLGPPWSQAQVNAQGYVELTGLKPGRHALRVHCAGGIGQTEEVEVAAEPQTRHWDLQRGFVLRGHVETPLGRRVANTRVSVTPVVAFEGGSEVHCVTGGEGEFSCPGLSAGAYDAAVVGRDEPGKSQRVSMAETTPAIVLQAPASGTIIATPMDTGRDCPMSSQLFAMGKNRLPIEPSKSEAGLVFEELPLGHYEVSSGLAADDAARDGSFAAVDLARDGQVVSVSVPSVACSGIAGVVLDGRGQPVLDAWLSAVPSNTLRAGRLADQVAPVLTGKQGEFALSGLAPGAYDLRVSNRDGEGELRAIPTGAPHVVVRLEPYGSLSLRVVTDAGEPVAAFQVRYQQRGSAPRQGLGQDGHWLGPWLEPGTYELQIQAEQGSARETVELAAGAQRELTVPLTSRRQAAPASERAAAVQEPTVTYIDLP